MLTIPTIPGQDTIGVYSGGFNSPSTDTVGNFYLLTDPTSTYYLVSPDNNNVYPTYPSVFSPLSLAPALWLDDTGSDASVWTDMSGNGRNASQADSAKRPSIVTNALNGKQVRRFDGADDFLSLTTGLGMLRNVPGATVIAAYKWITNPIINKAVFFASTGVSTEFSRYFIGGGNVSRKLLTGGRRLDSDAFAKCDSSADNLNSFFIHSGVADYANSDVFQYVNGVNDGINNTFQTDGNTSDTNSLQITIGTAGTSPSNCANIELAEILVFPTALSDFNRQQVEQYLDTKYNISPTYLRTDGSSIFRSDGTSLFIRP